MPSPFPGMDPFLEGQEWEDFHARLNMAIADAMSPRIEPAYVVRVERRVYLEGPGEEHEHWRRADAAIVTTETAESLSPAASSATAVAPTECIVPMPEERRATYLVIRDRENMEVVTVIETLSPANKRSGDGRREYLAKREEVISSQAHLVELDLLRGGERMPMNSRFLRVIITRSSAASIAGRGPKSMLGRREIACRTSPFRYGKAAMT
ncbi:MAG: hypothetical protein CMJ64_30125 [Planctomycetaceae bacterium]|nr:hypothetical protein [Planctomycetaceae bacterium]